MSKAMKAKAEKVKIQLREMQIKKPLSEEKIKAWETENKIILPLGYRYYLSQISNGGPGFDAEGIPSLKFSKKMLKPFPLKGPWADLDQETVEELKEQGLDDAEGTPLKWAYSLPKGADVTDGCIEVGNAADGSTYILVLNGPFAGQVWSDGRGLGGSPVHPAAMAVDGHLKPTKKELEASEFLTFLLAHLNIHGSQKSIEKSRTLKNKKASSNGKSAKSTNKSYDTIVNGLLKDIPKAGSSFEQKLQAISHSKEAKGNLSSSFAEELVFQLMGKPDLSPYFDFTPIKVLPLPKKCRLQDVMLSWRTLRSLMEKKERQRFDSFVIDLLSFYDVHEQTMEVLVVSQGQPSSVISDYGGKLLKYRKIEELENLITVAHRVLQPCMKTEEYVKSMSTLLKWMHNEGLAKLIQKLSKKLK